MSINKTPRGIIVITSEVAALLKNVAMELYEPISRKIATLITIAMNAMKARKPAAVD